MDQIKTSFHYVPVVDPYKDWQGRQSEDFTPTERQLVVIAAVRAALQEKMFYTSDVLAFCKTFLGISAEQAAVGAGSVEGGSFGLDLYYARDWIGLQEGHAAESKAKERLKPFVGQALGTLVFNDMKRNSGMVITAIGEGKVFTLTGKRGAYKVTLTCSARQIENAMNRAFERGTRKDDFNSFVHTLPAPSDLVLI